MEEYLLRATPLLAGAGSEHRQKGPGREQGAVAGGLPPWQRPAVYGKETPDHLGRGGFP